MSTAKAADEKVENAVLPGAIDLENSPQVKTILLKLDFRYFLFSPCQSKAEADVLL
jgi:hypothetical protein